MAHVRNLHEVVGAEQAIPSRQVAVDRLALMLRARAAARPWGEQGLSCGATAQGGIEHGAGSGASGAASRGGSSPLRSGTQ